MSWNRSENGEAVRPSDVDATSSRAYVYVRRNIELVDDGGRPAHYRWEEKAVPRDDWEVFGQCYVNAEAIEALSQVVEELATAVGTCDMTAFYVARIRAGAMTLGQVPSRRRESVRAALGK